MISKTVLLTVATLTGAGLSTQAATTWHSGFDLATNETPDSPNELLNPNPAVPEWSYGSRDIVASTSLSLFGAGDHTNALHGNPTLEDFEGWQYDTLLISVVNISGSSQFGYAPGEMLIHPLTDASANTFNVIRWTAPATGTYDILAKWRTPDAGGIYDGVDSHLVLNGVSIFDATVGSSETSTSQNLVLTAGDTLDFVVGPGASGQNGNDSTVFSAEITLVPEPSSVFLAAAAIPLLMRRRRSVQA